MNIAQESLFKSGFSIKYITAWDNKFKREKFSGCLQFYGGNPQYLVCVDILNNNRNLLCDSDILITIGDYHNAGDIRKKIDDNKDVIFEFCKMTSLSGFTLDLESMKVVEREDFDLFLPVYGLHTLFIFENDPSTQYCLVNPSRNIPDNEFYSWLVSYIYSSAICLIPRGKIEDFPKQFLQAISSLCATKGNRKAVKVSTNISVLGCDMSDIGELILPIPGDKTTRFEKLVTKSMEQMTKHAGKDKK